MIRSYRGWWGALVALSCAVIAPALAQPKGDEWDYALTVQMGGMQMPLPASKVCARPDEGNTPPVDKHCQIKERKVSGATTSFRIVCGPPEPGEMKGQFTRKGDRVEGRYTMTQGGESMTVVAVGKRLGACDPSKPVSLEGRQ
ncbi:MAG: DUF3617 family protein [Pseudomonadota bacterium]